MKSLYSSGEERLSDKCSTSSTVHVLLIVPERACETTAHYARINDIITEWARSDYGVRVRLIVTAETRGKWPKWFVGIRHIFTIIRHIWRVQVLHIVTAPWRYLAVIAIARLFTHTKVVCGPNLFNIYFHTSAIHPDHMELLDSAAGSVMQRELCVRWGKYNHGLQRHIDRWKLLCARLCDDIVTLSSYNREVGVVYGIPRERMSILPLSAPMVAQSERMLPKECQRSDPPLASVLYMGALTRLKGFDQFLKLITNISEGRCHFLVAGDGVFRKELEQMIDKRSDVYYCGKMNRVEALAMMAQCDLYVQPSTIEMMATTTLEALRAGVPILSANILSQREAAVDGNMVFYRSGDMEDMIEKFEHALVELERLQAIAREHASRYEISVGAAWLRDRYMQM